MKRIGTAEFELQLLKGELTSVRSQLEVSLDCPDCKRRQRTIVFDRPGQQGRCTPTGHEFDGSVFSIEDRVSGAVAIFQYEYEPFIDTKYPDEKCYTGFERGAPSWVRFHFVMLCRQCGSTSEHSTQTNIVRPWKCLCSCGAPLYIDDGAPQIGWSAA